MLAHTDASTQVIAQRAGQESWLLVSQDDKTPTNPALSMDGTRVAFITDRHDKPALEIISLISDTKQELTSDYIKQFVTGSGPAKPAMALCDWSPIAWDMETKRVAYFGCAEDASYSALLVSEIADERLTPYAVAGSGVFSTQPRQVKWLDKTHLTITTPFSGDNDVRVNVVAP
jgi:hypothetical protein